MQQRLKMSKPVLTLVIIISTCVLYALELFPIPVTTLLSVLALTFSGVLTFTEAFSGFASAEMLLVIGLMIIVDALLESGLAGIIGRGLSKFAGKSENSFNVFLFVVGAVLSMFMTKTAMVATFIPVVASIAKDSAGRITRKNTYMTLAAAALVGGTGTLAASTATLVASNILESCGQRGMSFFEPLPVTLIVMAVVAVCYRLFIYRAQCRAFDFPETPDDNVENLPPEVNRRNAAVSGTIFAVCIVLFIVRPFNWELGLIAVSGALLTVLTGCIDGKKAMRNLKWSVLITICASLSIAKAFFNSGLGTIIIDFLLEKLGDSASKPLVLLTFFLLSSYLLSTFMSTGALVPMLCSIAVPMATGAGIDPMPIALACVFGSTLTMLTPATTTSAAMVQIAGYRFKDFFRIGLLFGITALAATWLGIALVYGLF